MQNHQAVIDTANGTNNFPHVEMTMAMTDEMKNCNPKPLQIIAEGNKTLLPQQTTTVNAVVITTNTNDVTGAYNHYHNLVVKQPPSSSMQR